MNEPHKNQWILLIIVALIGAIGAVVAGYLSGVNITFNDLQLTATQTVQSQSQRVAEEAEVIAPTYTPYPTYTPPPTPAPVFIIATPTPLSPTPTVDIAMIDASERWEEGGVTIRLSTEFNTAATDLLIKWEITNGTSKPLLIYRDPEMIQAEELPTGQALIVAKAYWNAARWDDCSHSDKVVIQPNETLSSRAYCAFYIRADYSKVKEIVVYLLGITDNIPTVKWRVEVPF